MENFKEEDGLYNVRFSIGVMFSTCFNHMVGVRNIYLFVEDLWLYNYDGVEHPGVLYEVFNTITMIEMFKFTYLEKYLNWSSIGNNLGLSDYQPFTRKRFKEV